MKQLLLFLSLPVIANTAGAQANDIAFMPDHEAHASIQGIYERYVQSLHEKIGSGEIMAFDSKKLKGPVEAMEVIGMDWLGIRFDKNHLAILIAGDKTVFVKKDDLDKLDATSTQMLLYLQEQVKLEWVTYQTIENNLFKLYDKLQERIYSGIIAGDLAIYRTDSVAMQMPVGTFDTAFDQERVEWDENLGDYLNYGKEEFTTEKINGTCRMEYSSIYYGITYAPFDGTGQLPDAPMCWIKAMDLRVFLEEEEEWLLFEAIWRVQ